MALSYFSRQYCQRPFFKVLPAALFDVPVLPAEFRAMVLSTFRTAAYFAVL
jgi:hypothetical protein